MLSRLAGHFVPSSAFVEGLVDAVSWMLSELAREGQLQLCIVYSGKGRWSLIRIVEPSEEVPIDKELLS